MTPPALTSALREAYDPEAGHWRSRLSPSALAAATAASAFRIALKAPGGSPDGLAAELASGLDAACVWLAEHQNDDGGWGDTPDSPSNLSTTVLAWSTLHAVCRRQDCPTLDRAGHWLANACEGPPTPERLAAKIRSAYGSDHTFAVPILLMCALNGVLGSGDSAWKLVPQLPCQLAMLPHALFRFLRLGVVSYALPALIAVGLCRHRQAPARNVPSALRRLLTRPLLRRLASLQPPDGGFLEAVPLSAFVAMSLAGCGLVLHPVTQKSLRFVIASQRPDDRGWPIDTNLDTWVTSLAVQAFGSRDALAKTLADESAPDEILRHLLNTQHQCVHPYTRARPGGWAWTDLSGAVPDADDTAGALVALDLLCPAGHPLEAQGLQAAQAGLDWLLRVQNGDGGIPTFCRGWGHLPFDRSASDLTAHAVEALDAWIPRLRPCEKSRYRRARRRAIRFLLRHQAADGSWLPLWFGSQAAVDGENPVFGTARVLKALASHLERPGVRQAVHRGRGFLRARQHADGSWGQRLGDGATGTVEETGMVLCALPADDPARKAAEAWVQTNIAAHTLANPIGLYFAKLWYSEALYPVIWLASGLR